MGNQKFLTILKIFLSIQLINRPRITWSNGKTAPLLSGEVILSSKLFFDAFGEKFSPNKEYYYDYHRLTYPYDQLILGPYKVAGIFNGSNDDYIKTDYAVVFTDDDFLYAANTTTTLPIIKLNRMKPIDCIRD
jgi:hypothetical protein